MDQGYRILVQSFCYFHANSHVMLSSALEGPASLLILRTYRLFNRRVWLAYDKAFCEHLAAVKVVDWSTMNIQLYNFCAAGALVCGRLDIPLSKVPEMSGAALSQIVCRTWSRGLSSTQ